MVWQYLSASLCAFIIYDIIRRQRNSGKKDKETEKLKAELERLRAAADKKIPKKNTAYTQLDMPVTKDMNVFADWGTHSAQPY